MSKRSRPRIVTEDHLDPGGLPRAPVRVALAEVAGGRARGRARARGGLRAPGRGRDDNRRPRADLRPQGQSTTPTGHPQGDPRDLGRARASPKVPQPQAREHHPGTCPSGSGCSSPARSERPGRWKTPPRPNASCGPSQVTWSRLIPARRPRSWRAWRRRSPGRASSCRPRLPDVRRRTRSSRRSRSPATPPATSSGGGMGRWPGHRDLHVLKRALERHQEV
jgi:hypothetical protein